ncbi:ABC transporter ATP-binding protein [Bombilactobacillus folatiphilus]|uniref:ABC transporter ATP-binding protein n=1 Tax=Bombilactobacillus folatiphilus TaxID=2923362 RepID=A0ABY4P758_9LACO|nr:ABC transporter ATP-binding protein [Bombilactobacillus folatiphilus]UQS81449.1 ABC transporter ATP-binding protein [Bombilactobacillus folatiphilus]
MSLLELKHVKKNFEQAESIETVEALKDISFEVQEGDYIAIMGESGSGKSTLLNLIATLDQPTSGSLQINGQNLADLSENQAALYRRKNLGFVFQNFNLLNTFNNQDNILLPLVLNKTPVPQLQQRLMPLAKSLKLTELLKRYPYEVSGGQRQRIAAARALITKPQIILADEPTGALDSYNSELLLRLFEQINQAGQTILMVTHSALAASHAKRILFIKDGLIFHEIFRGEQTSEQYLQQITNSAALLVRG